MKLFLLGHAEHGKGTAAGIIRELTGLTSTSSSWFACTRYIWPRLQQMEPQRYANAIECHADRVNRRVEWNQWIKRINARDPSRLSREIFEQFDIYDGARDLDEFKASNHLADRSIWIDASERKPLESSDSMTIPRSMADVIRHAWTGCSSLPALIEREGCLPQFKGIQGATSKRGLLMGQG